MGVWDGSLVEDSVASEKDGCEEDGVVGMGNSRYIIFRHGVRPVLAVGKGEDSLGPALEECAQVDQAIYDWKG